MQAIPRTFALLALISGCSRSAEPSPELATADVRLRVVVTSQPLLEMAQAVGHEAFDVIRIVPDSTTSRDWKPRPGDVRALQQARLILINGAGYEPWKDRVSLPGSRLHDTAAGYYDQFIRIPDAVMHQHGPEGQHSHPGTVWATWLDPNLAISQLSQVAGALIRLSPEKKSDLETAAAKLKAQLENLNSLIAELSVLKGSNEITVISDGPCYLYLLKRLGWNGNYLHWADSGNLTEANLTEANRDELSAIARTMSETSQRVFLMSTRCAVAAEEVARQAGFTVVRIDLGEFPVDPPLPFVERMRANLVRLKAGVFP